MSTIDDLSSNDCDSENEHQLTAIHNQKAGVQPSTAAIE